MRERVRELSESLLVDAVAAGDPRAAAELYRRHHDAVRAYALSILRDREDAADVAQVVMTKAIDGMGRHRPRRLRPWLMGIARNEALMLLRSRVPKEALSPNVPAAGTVDGTFALREEVAGLVVDLRALPQRQRAALVLRQLYELSYRDIGALLGVRPGTARESVLQARRSLLTRARGREQDCGDIRVLLRDGRARRAVLVRAHLEACASCRAASQPSLAARLKGLLPVPEPVLPPLLLRLLAGPGSGVRTGGAGAACLCTFVLGLGIIGEVRRGDDGPPRAGARADVQSPDRDGMPATAASTAASQTRLRAARRRSSAAGAVTSRGGPLPVNPGTALPVTAGEAQPERRPDLDAGKAKPVESEEPYVEVEVMNGAVTVGGPPPALPPIAQLEPPQLPPPPPIPVPMVVESAALVGPLAG